MGTPWSQKTALPHPRGYSERTHGLSDTLLSVLPIRAMEILEDMAGGASWSLERRPEDVALSTGVV